MADFSVGGFLNDVAKFFEGLLEPRQPRHSPRIKDKITPIKFLETGKVLVVITSRQPA